MGSRRSTWPLAIVAVTVLVAGLISACGSSEEGAAQYSDRTESPLLEFGEEGTDAELEEADTAVSEFFVDRAEKDYSAACARLARSMLDRIDRLATNSTNLRDTSCASFLAAFLELTPAERRDSTTVDAGSLRRQGSRGYLIYAGVDDSVYAMPLSKEAGEWKLALLSSKALN